MRLIRTGIAIAVLAASALVPAQVAAADDVNFFDGGGGFSFYSDTGNMMWVKDAISDGHSTVAVYWRPGGTKHKLWDHNGNNKTLGYRHFARSQLENKKFYVKVCKGEWAKRASDRVVMSRTCGKTYTFLS